jgi:hypothetical protein
LPKQRAWDPLSYQLLVDGSISVQLVGGAASHENTGNQFGHPAPIVTFIFLATTAVLQIICLNRGLKVYDSTLVVPVFYGVYTATGWLNSLIFTNATDAFASWTLFLIFVSILVLISGVVLLTHKKPDVPVHAPARDIALAAVPPPARARKGDGKDTESAGLRDDAPAEVVWDVGAASDDDDDDDAHELDRERTPRADEVQQHRARAGEEGAALIGAEGAHEDDDEDAVGFGSSGSLSPDGDHPVQVRRRSSSTARNSDDGYGAFAGAT